MLATEKAIFAEMKKMRDKPVPPEELEMVRNYLLGMLLNGLDGPMNTSDMVRRIFRRVTMGKFCCNGGNHSKYHTRTTAGAGAAIFTTSRFLDGFSRLNTT